MRHLVETRGEKSCPKIKKAKLFVIPMLSAVLIASMPSFVYANQLTNAIKKLTSDIYQTATAVLGGIACVCLAAAVLMYITGNAKTAEGGKTWGFKIVVGVIVFTAIPFIYGAASGVFSGGPSPF